MEIIIGIIAFILGATISWLYVIQKTTRKMATLESELAVKNEKSSDIQTLQEAHDKTERTLLEANVALEATITIKAQIEKDLKALKLKLDEKEASYNSLNNENAKLKANYTALQEKLENQKKDIEALNKKFVTEFENVANKILDDKSEKFTKSNKTNIEGLLKPLS